MFVYALRMFVQQIADADTAVVIEDEFHGLHQCPPCYVGSS